MMQKQNDHNFCEWVKDIVKHLDGMELITTYLSGPIMHWCLSQLEAIKYWVLCLLSVSLSKFSFSFLLNQECLFSLPSFGISPPAYFFFFNPRHSVYFMALTFYVQLLYISFAFLLGVSSLFSPLSFSSQKVQCAS